MIMRKCGILLMLTILAAVWVFEPASAQGMYGNGPCVARNAVEGYCVNHGGCPSNGYCYFPDGSYCELWSFYNGTCPGRAYYEQAVWLAEAYRFLNGDEGYNPAYSYPSYGYYYNYDYQPYWQSYGPYRPVRVGRGGISQ